MFIEQPPWFFRALYPDESRMVVEHGHRIGNHTFNHIRGFEYSNPDYLANAQKVDEIIHSDLFRPPHGHMGFRQYYTLRYHYRIIMWDLVTRDYSKRMRPEQVLNNVKRYARNGSIITFHDSLKSACGAAPAEAVSEKVADTFRQWLADGCQGEMAYMQNYEDKRLDPRLLVEGARTVISVALNYYPETKLPENEYQIA